jgi:hypothetical protein
MPSSPSHRSSPCSWAPLLQDPSTRATGLSSLSVCHLLIAITTVRTPTNADHAQARMYTHRALSPPVGVPTFRLSSLSASSTRTPPATPPPNPAPAQAVSGLLCERAVDPKRLYVAMSLLSAAGVWLWLWLLGEPRALHTTGPTDGPPDRLRC